MQLPGDPSEDPKTAALVDRLAGEVVLRHASGRRALDLGIGRPRVAEWVEQAARQLDLVTRAEIAALSERVADKGAEGRAEKGREIGLQPELQRTGDPLGAEVTAAGSAEASADAGPAATPTPRLPFADGTFDLVYSLRTFPHLGLDEDSSDASFIALLAEVARVLAPDGAAVLELYNPHSLWGVAVGVRRPAALLDKRSLVLSGEVGVTRFDSLTQLTRLLPPSLHVAGVHGVRVASMLPQVLDLPLVGPWVGRWLERLERQLRDASPTRGFGAHLLVELRRKGADAPQ